jgi:hypothetical protein
VVEAAACGPGRGWRAAALLAAASDKWKRRVTGAPIRAGTVRGAVPAGAPGGARRGGTGSASVVGREVEGRTREERLGEWGPGVDRRG